MGPVRQNPIQRTVSLFICACIALCTIVAQNRPDSFPPFPPDNHHSSDDVYLRDHQSINHTTDWLFVKNAPNIGGVYPDPGWQETALVLQTSGVCWMMKCFGDAAHLTDSTYWSCPVCRLRLNLTRKSPSFTSSRWTSSRGSTPWYHASHSNDGLDESLHTMTATVLFFDSELRFYVPLDTKQVISETFFLANLLASTTVEIKSNTTKVSTNPERKNLLSARARMQ